MASRARRTEVINPAGSELAHNRAVVETQGPATAVSPPREDVSALTGSQPASKRARIAGLCLVLVVAVVPLLLGSVFYLYTHPADPSALLRAKLTRLVLQETAALALLVYVLRRQHRDLGDIGFGFRTWDLAASVMLLLGGAFAVYVADVACTQLHFVPRAADQAHTQAWVAVIRASTLGVVLVCLNPVFEELIVRAYVITEVRALSGSAVAAVVASTAVQAGYHLYQGGPAAVRLSAMFLVFSIYFAKTRRATPLILAHFYLDIFGVFR